MRTRPVGICWSVVSACLGLAGCGDERAARHAAAPEFAAAENVPHHHAEDALVADGAPTFSPGLEAQLQAIQTGTSDTLETAVPVTAELLGQLQSVSGLRQLKLHGPPQSADAVEQLAACGQLIRLTWEDCNLDDREIALLCQLRQLQSLNLTGTRATNSGLTALRDLNELTLLRLGSPLLTDGCLAELQQVPQLKQLILVDAPITDASLTEIHDWQHLESLYLFGTQVTEPGLARLQQALPHAHLHW